MTAPALIPLDQIRADTQAQPRAALMTDTIENYVERMAEGDEFPPLTVFFDGSVYWLGDGFHRYHAAVGCGLAEFACDVREGGLRDAVLYSVGANAAHGLQRTNDDKRRAAMKLLNDPEWSQWSDREIARRCGVAHPFVGKLRPQPDASGNGYQIERKVERNGTVYTQNTGNIGGNSKLRPRDNGPVFDNTPFGGHTPPAGNAETDRINANAWIGTTIGHIIEHAKKLPDPREAARRRTPGMKFARSPEEFDRIATWFAAFAKEWRALDRQEKDNVAAE
jgi:hypothetical protein